MKKIDKIIVGTHNNGKFKEICDLLPENITKISPKDLNLSSPNETGSTFKENSKIKAEYFAKKANLISISDDSGLMIDLLSITMEQKHLQVKWVIGIQIQILILTEQLGLIH